MKRVEVTSLSERDLVVQEFELSRDLAGLKFRHALGQVENSSELRDLRRHRARLKTEVRRRELEAGLALDELYRRHAGSLSVNSDDKGGSDVSAPAKTGGLMASLRRRLSGESKES